MVATSSGRFAASLLAGCMFLSSASSQAQTLYAFRQGVLFDGRYGPIARVQGRVRDALVQCGKPATVKIDGYFGNGLKSALAELSKCPAFAAALASDGDAKNGVLTVAYWKALMSEPVPSVDARARTIMLTFEATDYTQLEWNFCQSKPLYAPSTGQNVCYSNDRHSYLTWGPNGATAGNGREIQNILIAIDKVDPILIDASFGSETGAVRRMFRLQDGGAARSLETYLCGIWADSARRSSWRAGFNVIGQKEIVRTTFDDVYKSVSFDGGKIATFYRAYAAHGLTPSEIDYAFFKDRAAHTTPVYAAINKAISKTLAADLHAPRWKIRQGIALRVRPDNDNQRASRLGRDVAFYIDGASGALSAEELTDWSERGRLRASDAGLSDDRPSADFSPGPAIQPTSGDWLSLIPAEIVACPRPVLNTVPPPKVRRASARHYRAASMGR